METNQTVWQRPEGPNVKVVDGSTAVATQNSAPVTWFRCCTPQNQFYFNCPATGQTVWERPSGPNDHIMDHPAMPQQHQAAMQAMAPMGAYGAMPGCMPGMMPGMVPGMMPGTIPGIMPGIMPGIIPGTMPGIMPGMQPGMAPYAPMGAIAWQAAWCCWGMAGWSMM